MSTLHRKRAIAHGANAAVLTLAAAGILVIGYMLVDRFRPFRKDFTQAGIYSLAPKSAEILGRLDREVKVTYFRMPPSASESADAMNRDVEDLLTEYKARSKGHLSFTIANPLADAERLEELGGDLGAAVFQAGDAKIVVQSKEIVKEDYESGEGVRFTGEEAFDSALLRLIEGKSKLACFLTGHGEAAIDAEADSGYALAKDLLRRENLESKTVNLTEADAGNEALDKKVSLDKAPIAAPPAGVPADCTVLVIAGPQAPIGGSEADAIVKFWENGGGVMLMAEPMTKSGVEALAARFGVEILAGVVADPQRKLRSPLAILPVFVPHEIVNPLSQAQTPVVLAKAVGMKPMATLPEGVTAEPFLQTSAAGIELVDIKNGEADPDSKKNIQGPITVAIAVEKKIGDAGKTARAVVLGDADFAANAALQRLAMGGAPGNIDLLKNAVAWTSGSTEKIGIGPKGADHHPITITDSSALLILASTSAGMPLFIFSIGISVWLRRRRR